MYNVYMYIFIYTCIHIYVCLDVRQSPNNKGHLGFIKENMIINKNLGKPSFP